MLIALFHEDLPNLLPVRDALRRIDVDGSNPNVPEPLSEDVRQQLWLASRQEMLDGIQRAINHRLELAKRSSKRWRKLKEKFRKK